MQQISESENKYINENSEEKILSIAGNQIAKFLVKKFQKKSILFIAGAGIKILNLGIDPFVTTALTIMSMVVFVLWFYHCHSEWFE